jgi:hypothetical protein
MKKITTYLAIIRGLLREAKQMKKNIICMIIICTLFIFYGCGGGGGGGSSNTPVTISVSFQNNHASNINPKDLPLTHVRYIVTGPKMKDMQGSVPVIGDAADIDLMVPSGPQRLFKIQILDLSGAVAYFGDTTADLTGEPVTLVIPLREIPRCNDIVHEGSDNPETFTIDLGKRSGTFQFDYETYSVKDRMIITYEGNTLYDSGCIGTDGIKTEYISYSGNSTAITVAVQPNCEGAVSTKWDFVVYCPQEQVNKIVGTWAHVALERLNDGAWGSILETVIFRNDGTGAEINRRVNFGGNVNLFDRINFTYTTNQNQDGSTNLTMVYPDRAFTHKIIMSDNGNMVIIDRTSDASSKRIDVVIKMDISKSYTNADFFGDYYGTTYNYYSGNILDFGYHNSWAGIVSSDGIGNYFGTGTWNNDGVIITQNDTLTYSVNTEGSIVTGNGSFEGFLGANNLFITSRPTVNNHWKISFGMKKGDRTYSTADLAGTWALTGFGDANQGTSYGDMVGIMSCDSVGNCTATLKSQKDGDIINEPIDFQDISIDPFGSFGVLPNTIAPSYSAAIGNNGNTLLMNRSFGQSALYDREILIGVRCTGCTNLAGHTANLKTKKIYHFRKHPYSLNLQNNPE